MLEFFFVKWNLSFCSSLHFNAIIFSRFLFLPICWFSIQFSALLSNVPRFVAIITPYLELFIRIIQNLGYRFLIVCCYSSLIGWCSSIKCWILIVGQFFSHHHFATTFFLSNFKENALLIEGNGSFPRTQPLISSKSVFRPAKNSITWSFSTVLWYWALSSAHDH